jgi:uncharacterized protein (DUF2267 family)
MGGTPQYHDFIAIVEREVGTGRDEAERAVRATLTTLAERISGGEAEDVARQLPPELRPLLHDGAAAEGFHLHEFLRRVAQREGVSLERAEEDARAVFAALGGALSAKEIADMAAELPKDFEPLLAEARAAAARDGRRRPAVIGLEDFIERVARLSGLPPPDARRASEAVLEALADRISAGEVDDLAARLPAAFAPALDRGKARSKGVARPLSLDRFLQHIAEQEGVTPEQARQHARAVFATLREAIGEKEFADVTAQLPDDYAVLLPRP